VRESIEAGAAPDAATLETLDEASRTITGKPSGLDPAGFADAMSARAFVERRTIYGGPAPSAAERERAELLDRLSAAEDRERERAAQIEAAAAELEAAIDAIVAG
jgi:argininosuccinate lyase